MPKAVSPLLLRYAWVFQTPQQHTSRFRQVTNLHNSHWGLAWQHRCLTQWAAVLRYATPQQTLKWNGGFALHARSLSKAICTHETKHILFFLRLFKPFKNCDKGFASDVLSRAVEVHRVQFRFTAVHRCTTEEMNKHRHNDDTGPHEATYIKMTVITMVVANMWSGWRYLVHSQRTAEICEYDTDSTSLWARGETGTARKAEPALSA